MDVCASGEGGSQRSATCLWTQSPAPQQWKTCRIECLIRILIQALDFFDAVHGEIWEVLMSHKDLHSNLR